MKIAQISYHTCPLAAEEGKETGGMNVYVYNLSLELARLGHMIDVFTRSEDANAKKIVEVYRAPNGARFRVIHLPAGPEKTLPKKELIKYIPEFSKNLSKFLETLNPAAGGVKGPLISHPYNLLHAHYYMSGLAVLHLRDIISQPPPTSRISPIPPTVVSFHTLALLKNLVARSPAESESQERIDAETEIVKRFDKIIAPSAVERDYLKYFYSAEQNSDSAEQQFISSSQNSTLQKITVIPPGFDASIFHPMDKPEARKKIGADPNHKIILFVGRIEPLKGLDVLMYALKILTQKCRACPICLWIVGGDKHELTNLPASRLASIRRNGQDGRINEFTNNNIRNNPLEISENPELKRLYELNQTLKLHSYVRFIGQQHQSQLPDFYNAADVVVMPSHYESFGMSALEAMACGVPVVTTNVTGISTMFESGRQHTVISANNPLELAAAIEKILNHKKSFWEKQKNVQDFSWKKMVEKMIRLYERINTN